MCLLATVNSSMKCLLVTPRSEQFKIPWKLRIVYFAQRVRLCDSDVSQPYKNQDPKQPEIGHLLLIQTKYNQVIDIHIPAQYYKTYVDFTFSILSSFPLSRSVLCVRQFSEIRLLFRISSIPVKNHLRY